MSMYAMLIIAGVTLAGALLVDVLFRDESPAGIVTGYDPNRRDELGWLDYEEQTVLDRARIAKITGVVYGSNEAVTPALSAPGSRGSLTATDFELLRQDRRRARAFYPDVPAHKLFASGWFHVRYSAKVPVYFCTTGHLPRERRGRYLDGGCYLFFVRPEYPHRADAATTNAYFGKTSNEQ